MNEQIENDIVKDAYYLISKFNNEGRPITQLQVQKLMYLIEALYCYITGRPKLYECNFNAWAYGPVAIPLYKELRKYGNSNIQLLQSDLEKVTSVSDEKKVIIDKIFDIFKSYSAMALVNMTHDPDGPWYEVWNKNNQKVVYGEDSAIPKNKVVKWFRDKFISSNGN